MVLLLLPKSPLESQKWDFGKIFLGFDIINKVSRAEDGNYLLGVVSPS